MAATLVNGGALRLLSNILNVLAPETLSLELYTNNHTPVVGDTLAAYTLCTLSGYAPLTLTPGSWVVGASGGIGTALYPASTFDFDAYAGGTTIYGYVIVADGELAAAELYGVPFPVDAGGDALTVAPSMSLRELP